MSRLLRYFAPGQTCFVTSVTNNRRNILVEHHDLIYRAIRHARKTYDFAPVAWVIIPDHFHFLLTCPNGDTSQIIKSVKLSFSRRWRELSGVSGPVWQSRFWDHIIRDEEDFKRHFDYIHYNPVKHRWTGKPSEWNLSSFGLYLRKGIYQGDWSDETVGSDDEFGE